MDIDGDGLETYDNGTIVWTGVTSCSYLKQMKLDNIPNFHQFGDWCAIESRAVCSKNTGPPAAAANYVLAVEAMAKMAEALGETADKVRAIRT